MPLSQNSNRARRLCLARRRPQEDPHSTYERGVGGRERAWASSTSSPGLSSSNCNPGTENGTSVCGHLNITLRHSRSSPTSQLLPFAPSHR